tara:strand:- start:1327 stop:4422 length:3096 start_codon:yes stop_codon:yes gene_type:complete
MTYKENIERLRRRQKLNLKTRQKNTADRINFIANQEKEAIQNIEASTDLLVGKQFGSPDIVSGEGGIIPFKYGEYITKQEEKGIKAEKLDRAERVARLEKRLQEISDTDTAHLNVKYDMLLNGYLYEDADRFAKLSPHAQTAYARRKLGLWKESVGDKLNYKMAKDNTEYTLNELPGKKFTAAGLHNDPLVPPIIKEAFVDRVLNDLIEENGINGFSDELLELEGINDFVNPKTGQIEFGAHSKAKNTIMAKYRKGYNISSSHAAEIMFMENFKSDRDIAKLITGLKGLVTDDGKTIRGPLKAWEAAEKLLASMLVNGDINAAELKDAFEKSPSPTMKGKTAFESHEARYNNILRKAAYEKQQLNSAADELSDAKADEFERNTKIDLMEGGPLYQELYVDNDLGNKSFKERQEIVNRALLNVQAKWISEGGEWDTSKGTFAPWIHDLYTDLVYIDQDEIIANATAKLDNDIPLRPQDTHGASLETLQTLSRHKKWGPNQGLIRKHALQVQTVTPNGQAGTQYSIPDLVKTALKDNKLDYENKDLINHISTRAYNKYFKPAWDEAWLDQSGTMTPDKAFDYAMNELKWNLGVEGVLKNGKRRDSNDIIKDLQYNINYEPVDIKRITDIGQYLAERLVKHNMNTSEPLTNQRLWIWGYGPESAEFKKLVKYAENGEGGIPQIYNYIAAYMPNHTAEDLANWQLAQVGMTLPTTSAVNEAMKITEQLAGFNRLIGYKTNSTDIQQAKIIALDGKKFCTAPTWDTNLEFDKDGNPIHPPIEDNPNYMGNNLEGWLEKYGYGTEDLSEEQQVVEEADRLNDVYIYKGFHDEPPGPKPKKEDFPLQPGDEIDFETYGYGYSGPLSMDVAKYNIEAYNEALRNWREKKENYRPWTKKITTGGRSKTTYTGYFNPETDTYESKDIHARLFPETKVKPQSGRARISAIHRQKHLDARLKRANALPDSKVVNIHTEDGRYYRGPITVYKHVDERGYVKWKLAAPGSETFLQSFWNIPGSPVLSPSLQDYAMELYNAKLQTV